MSTERETRYFKATDETDKWRVIDESEVYFHHKDDWIKSTVTLSELIHDPEIIETDAHGNPLPAPAPSLPTAPFRKHGNQVDQEIRDSIVSALRGDAYVCGRVWSAWQVGTMTEDDFSPAWESEDLVSELENVVLDAIHAATDRVRDQPAPAAGDTTDAHARAEAFLAEMHFTPTNTAITSDDSKVFEFTDGGAKALLDVYPDGTAVIIASWKPEYEHMYELNIDRDQAHIAKILASYGVPWGVPESQRDGFIPNLQADLAAARADFARWAAVIDSVTLNMPASASYDALTLLHAELESKLK